MKCKKIALLGCGAIFFVAASQLISCGGGGGGGGGGETVYTVSMDSKTLVIDAAQAKKGNDFNAKISLNENRDPTYIALPHSIVVKVDNKVIQNYTYTAEGDNSGKLTIPSANVNGNIVITGEADKTTKSVGDYAHIFVSGSEVSFDIENVQAGEYIINAVTDNGESLDRYYTKSGSQQHTIYPNITITEAGTNKITFKKNNGNINSYVTASLIQVVGGSNTELSNFRLLNSYNKKGVAFKYKLPLAKTSTSLKATPIIVDGATYLADLPNDLTKLLPSPMIYSKTFSQNILEMKTGVSINRYYVAKNDEAPDYEGYFLAYFDKIPENGALLSISSLVKQNYNIELNHDSMHKIFVECATKPNTTYYAYNDYMAPIVDAYAAENFEQLQLQGQHSFFSTSEKTLVVYKLENGTSKLNKISGYNIGEYSANFQDGTIALTDAYKSKSMVLGAHPDESGADKVIAEFKQFDESNSNYSFIIKATTANNNIVKDGADQLLAYCTEHTGSSSTTTKLISFGLIARTQQSGKYVSYYAPIAAKDSSGNITKNYYTKDTNTISVTIDKIAVAFNDKVGSGDTLNVYGCAPVLISVDEHPENYHVSYMNNQNFSLSYTNAFVGIPSSCHVTPISLAYRRIEKNNISVKYEGEGGASLDFSYDNDHVSFTPTKLDGVHISATAYETSSNLNFSVESKEGANFTFEDLAATTIKLHGASKTTVKIVPKTGWTLKNPTKTSYDIYAFDAHDPAHKDKEGRSSSVRPISATKDGSNDAIVLTYPEINPLEIDYNFNFGDCVGAVNEFWMQKA